MPVVGLFVTCPFDLQRPIVPRMQIVIVGIDVDDVFGSLRRYNARPRAINFFTGPSRTADIEQTLEIGAYGPRLMHVLLIESRPE